ncbi:hypothetical protein BB561_005977 [Smittium simulii]|uniref:ENTH domain-containing protein n=1 Tax=Smittium simulii TaxID=133385 RepID=A0A2T9Y791_9FUNG|nr:hypothetical protein BB561_005977 [Smittium simulii]
MSNAARSVIRSVKNYTKGYSDIQNKVRSATSNSPDSAPTSTMAEIADATYNTVGLIEVMEILDKRLNDKGKYWRHVYKSLVLLDYLLRFGSEKVISYCQQNLYIIKTLKEFLHIDEQGYDRGLNVRKKAAGITELLMDRDKLKSIRSTRASYKNEDSYSINTQATSDYRTANRSGNSMYQENEEERQLRLAIEESKKEADLRKDSLNNKSPNSQINGSSNSNQDNEDAALQKALKESALEAKMSLTTQSPALFNQNAYSAPINNPNTNPSTDGMLLDFNNGWNSNPNPMLTNQPSQPFFSLNNMDLNNGYQSTFPQNNNNDMSANSFSNGLNNPQMMQGNTINNSNSMYTLQNNLPQSTDNNFNPFAQSTNLNDNSNNSNHPFNVTGQFGNVFDNGATTKPLPFGVDTSAPSAMLAEIARNSNKIDPFASLAATSSATTHPINTSTNPFESAQNSFTPSNIPQTNNHQNYSDIFATNLPQNNANNNSAFGMNSQAQNQTSAMNPFSQQTSSNTDPFANTNLYNFNNTNTVNQNSQPPIMNQNIFNQSNPPMNNNY